MAPLELVLCRLVAARPAIAIARPKRLAVPRPDAPDHGQAAEPSACNIDSLELASFPTQAPARFGETACQSAGCGDGRRAAVAITTPRSEGATAVNKVGGTLAGYKPAEPLAGDVNYSGHKKDGQARGLGRRV